MGVPVPSYRIFLLISAGLHLAVLSLLPADVVVQVVSLGAHPGATPRSGPPAHDFVLLDGYSPLQVVELATEPRSTASSGESQESTPRSAPAPPLPDAEPAEPGAGEPPVVVEAAAGTATADAAPAPRAPGVAGATGPVAGTAATVGEAAGAASGDAREALLVPPVAVALVWPEIEPDGRRERQTPVELLVHVTATGEVNAVRVVTPTGCAACEAAAIEAAQRLRFRPARRGSTPVAIWWPFTFEFRR
ncbi:MAG: TonB family protein [Candidatus Eiseniibacteriota bacterium]|jgi:protein TonB